MRSSFFFCGAIVSNAFFTSDRIQLAGQALENAADIGSGMIAAAADAAAASAGMGAHLAGKAAAEAGALAAAASGVSAASTLAGDVIGGQLAFGADILSQLVPRPFHRLAAIASGSLAASNTLALTHPFLPPFLPPFTFFGLPGLNLACASFLSELFSLKPILMTPLSFYHTIRGVVESYFDPVLNSYIHATPADFLARLNGALDLSGDVQILPAVQQDLVALHDRFPIICTPLFLQHLHDFVAVVADTLVGGWPVFPPDWFSLPFGPHFGGHLGGRNTGIVDTGITDAPLADIAVAADLDQAGTFRQDNTQTAINIFDTTVVAGPNADISNTSIQANPTTTITNTQTGNQQLTATPDNSVTVTTGDITSSNTNTNTDTVLGYTRPFETRLGLDASPQVYQSPPGVQTTELSPVVGTISLPQLGTYPLLASPNGEMTVNIPGTGLVTLLTMPNGHMSVMIPGYGPVTPNIATTIAVATIQGVGSVPLVVTADGLLVVEVPGLGTVPVSTSTAGGLTVSLPNVGSTIVTLPVPARMIVFVPGYGRAPLTISPSGVLSVALYGIGSIPVTSSSNGVLTTIVPGVGVVTIRGHPRIPARPLIDHVFLPHIGCFPVYTQPNGAVVVPIAGLGNFPVTTSSSGNMQITTPLGPFDVATVNEPETVLHTPAAHTSSVVTHPSVVVPHPSTVVNHTPTVVTHTPAVVTHTPTVVTHTPAVVTHTPAVVTHTPAVVTHTPAVVTHTPAIVAHPSVAVAPVASSQGTFSASGRLSHNGPFANVDVRGDVQGDWVWGLSDAAVYFLQNIDVFRPASMSPERFLTIVNQTICSLRLTINWRTITPLVFIHALVPRLGTVVDVSSVAVESIGKQMMATDGSMPPFHEVLDHISAVITDKLDL
eukprot:Blabericola_migrator_1__2255@NODE_1622_length_4149_cov_39_027438_g1057_i0_p1_GENE_NODE_1622_length_4149_cov_39_027438_g1057_i0NODE_1622_length_4149_cov_39_027438_g1057_i0_p1_ORF_typecomplete_len890_score131_33Chorion_3/PF05387_11/3_7Chorion_3/PF05387_11/4_3_NODE_1622_length_4149_cov_39_027438_g1057_i08643533